MGQSVTCSDIHQQETHQMVLMIKGLSNFQRANSDNTQISTLLAYLTLCSSHTSDFFISQTFIDWKVLKRKAGTKD